MSREKYRSDKALPLRLLEARKALDLTYRKAAEEIGCSPGYLSNVEKGHFEPSKLFHRAAEDWLQRVGQRYNPDAESAPSVRESAAGWGTVPPDLRRDERLRKAVAELMDILRGPDQKATEWVLGNIQVFAERARAQLEPRKRRRAG